LDGNLESEGEGGAATENEKGKSAVSSTSRRQTNRPGVTLSYSWCDGRGRECRECTSGGCHTGCGRIVTGRGHVWHRSGFAE
jgi:hypothetical protein